MKNKTPGIFILVLGLIIASNLLIFKKNWNTPNYIILGSALVLMAIGVITLLKTKKN